MLRISRQYIDWIVGIGLVGALLVLASAAAAAPPPQIGTPIRYGDTLAGEITEAQACGYYWFEGRAGDAVTIDMRRTSGTLDGVMALYQRDGNNFTQMPLISNDDRPGGELDPLITFVLPATDWYTIAACRLQVEQTRDTTGTYTLTLIGPSGASFSEAVQPTAPPSLTEGLFGPGTTATPEPTLAAIGTLPGLGGESESGVAAGGGVRIEGTLAAEENMVGYSLSAQPGDIVVIDWQRVSGDFAPLIRVSDAAGRIVAQAATPEAVGALTLAFQVLPGTPAETTGVMLALAVARHGEIIDGTGGAFTLQINIEAGPTGNNVALATPQAEPVGGGSMAEPCQTAADATPGFGMSAQVASAYTASGDGLTAGELQSTAAFTTEDDLRVVFTLQNVAGPVRAIGVFCTPTGEVMQYDALSVTGGGGPNVIGLDWEQFGTPWPVGEWFVELYLNGEWALTLGFSVQ